MDADAFCTNATAIFPSGRAGSHRCSSVTCLVSETWFTVSMKATGHAFLQVRRRIVVDVTADQFGGPGVHVGDLLPPWERVRLAGPFVRGVFEASGRLRVPGASAFPFT